MADASISSALGALVLETDRIISAAPEGFLTSNDIVDTDLQNSSARETIRTLELSNATLEAGILELESRLSMRKDLLDRQRELLVRYRRAILGCGRIPIEIWSRIFEIATIIHAPVGRRKVFSFNNVPMSLSHVCRSWRSIAIGTPSVWSEIHWTISRYPHQSVLDLFLIFLERSLRHPLNISFRDNYIKDKYPFDDGTLKKIIDLLISNAERWKHVEFFCGLFRIVLFAQTLNCTVLERASLAYTPCDGSVNFGRWAGKRLFSGSSLKHLSLDLVCLELFISRDMISWSSLTTIDIGKRVRLTTVMKILSWSSNLTYLGLASAYVAHNEIHLIQPFIHTKLETLKMNNCPSRHMFQMLTAPKLLNLEIEGHHWDGAGDFTQFLEHISMLEALTVPSSDWTGLKSGGYFLSLEHLTLEVILKREKRDVSLLRNLSQLLEGSGFASNQLPRLTLLSVKVVAIKADDIHCDFLTQLKDGLISFSEALATKEGVVRAPRLRRMTFSVTGNVYIDSGLPEITSQIMALQLDCLDVSGSFDLLPVRSDRDDGWMNFE